MSVSPGDVRDDQGATPVASGTTPDPAPACVEAEGVSVRFGGLQALQDVSLDVKPGEIVGLIGPNGAGKTTAFNVICGFVKPTSGAVRFPSARRSRTQRTAALVLRTLPSKRLRGRALAGATGRRRLRPNQLAGAGVARTLQGVGLFPHLTVLENVMAGGQSLPHGGFLESILAWPTTVRSDWALRARALEELGRLDIEAYALRYPSQIPYGIAKKVAVARALLCDPSLLLLDEPASGLDDTELDEFAKMIVQLRERMGVLLVEHDMGFVMPLVDRLVVLNFGHVIARGTPSEVQANPAVIEAYLGVSE
jgi:branched-chain amino acid transport system ATP-binding protein